MPDRHAPNSPRKKHPEVLSPEEMPANRDVSEDRSFTPDEIQELPAGLEEVKRMPTSVGAASSGVLLEEDIDQARLRLRDAQVVLVELGYLTGEHGEILVDGQWGPVTRDAIASFQADHGLPQRAQLDAETYDALLAEHEAALEMKSPEDEQDDFAPVHAEKPLTD